MSQLDNVIVYDRRRIVDERGCFLKTMTGKEVGLGRSFGEIYITEANPGCAKGGHYHIVANEWFSLISGEAELLLVDVITGEERTIHMSIDKPITVFIPRNVAHLVRNVSNIVGFTLMAYSDRSYDPKDTIPFCFG